MAEVWTDLQLLSTEENPEYYEAGDLEQLALICLNLVDLSIDLSDLSLSTDDLGLLEPFRWLGSQSIHKYPC